jgi:hypothetical protein
MRASDILHMATAIRSAIKEAGTGEFNWMKCITILDEAGYDIVRQASANEPERVSQIGWIEPPASNGLLGHVADGELLTP